MANSFPSVPADLQLQSVTYQLNFSAQGLAPAANLTFDGVSTAIWGALGALGQSGGIEFTFATPGDAGSFDQAAAEAELAKIGADIFALMADLTGVPAATLEEGFSVQRVWTWTDSAGSTATYTDAMPVEPPGS